MAKYAIGDVVKKNNGRSGVVRAIFKTFAGDLCYAVENEGSLDFVEEAQVVAEYKDGLGGLTTPPNLIRPRYSSSNAPCENSSDGVLFRRPNDHRRRLVVVTATRTAARRNWLSLNFWKSKRVTGKSHRIAITMFDYDRKERASWGLTLTQPSTTQSRLVSHLASLFSFG
jgi:hypothetical protein